MADSLLGGIVINEILVDPNGAANFDTDGNGTAHALDEYVEIVNTANVAIDISGLELWDDGVGNWFTFPSGTILQPGGHAMVMSGVQSGGTLPTGGADDLFFDAGRGVSVINNGGDNVVLYDPNNDEYISATFNGDALDNPVADYTGFSATAAQSGTGENFGSDIDGYSIQRGPDGSDTFVNNEPPTPGYTNVCFTGGTWFETANGPALIETLKSGDQLQTTDRGLQTIKWIWAKKWTRNNLRDHPKLRPVKIKSGALGNGLPKQDLMVSRQHRILVVSKIAQRIFNSSEVLVPAKDLLELEGVDIAVDCEDVTYFHILFDRHEIVFANGVPSESLYLGRHAIDGMDFDAVKELCEIFETDIASLSKMASEAARNFVAGKRVRRLIYSHMKNGKPIISPIEIHQNAV